MTITLSKQQAEAVDAALAWYKTHSKVFILTGAAGTGKTSIAKYIAGAIAEEDGDVLYGAFTGKAAAVLESKGCTPASTIHGLIYKARLNESTGVWSFGLDYESAVRNAKVVILDEVSMLDLALGTDFMMLAKKVIVLGDPDQLPPINGEPFFDLTQPSFHLTEIHRQAAESPIIRLATDVRLGKKLQVGTYDDCSVIKNRSFNDQMMLEHDQTLVGRNNTRHGLNTRYRKATNRADYLPEVGDKLITLRNNRERGYINGEIWVADSVVYDSDAVEMMIAREAGGVGIKTLTFNDYFRGTEHELSWKQKLQNDELTYSYAITVHKFQGSQADRVLVVDESHVFREHANKWLYTGITRASEMVTVVI